MRRVCARRCTKSLRGYGELTGNKRVAQLTADDVLGTAAAMLSVFIREPEFQGQTKDRLSSPEAARHRRECRCATPSTIG